MRRSQRRDVRAVTLVAALVLALGAGSIQSPPPAVAVPAAPSWDDVETAKCDVEATRIAVARIIESVGVMNTEIEQLRIAALIAGEQFQQATHALEKAERAMATTERRRDAALDRADASGRQAAQLAAQLARAGGGDITVALLVSGDEADDLLYRLGTMTALSTRTDAVLSRAVQDRNVAQSLSQQALIARDAHAATSLEAETGFAAAAIAAEEAEQRAIEQRVLVGELSAKLAQLTGRSAELEREYLESLETPPPTAPQPEQPGPPPSTPPNSPPGPGTPAPGPSQPAPSAPPPAAPAPSPSPSQPVPPPTAPSPTTSPQPAPPPPASGPQPNAAAVASAIAFARAQLGEPYQFGSAGPDAWDCSGLTMMAYSAAGLAIGGHGATSQYTRASSRGLLVPYSQVQPGDLIFYSTGGSTSASKYHVAIAIGGGQMIEAPSPGFPVRVVTVRSYDRVAMVARPSG